MLAVKMKPSAGTSHSLSNQLPTFLGGAHSCTKQSSPQQHPTPTSPSVLSIPLFFFGIWSSRLFQDCMMRRIRRSAGAVLARCVPDLPLAFATDMLCALSGRTINMPVAKTCIHAQKQEHSSAAFRPSSSSTL